MADSLTTIIGLTIAADFKNTLTGTTGTAEVPINVRRSHTLSDGTSANQADKVWASFGRTLSASTTEDIDLFDLGTIDIGTGAGDDPLGNTVSYAEIVALYVANTSAAAGGSIVIGGKTGGTAQFNTFVAITGSASDTAQIGPITPGGFVMLYVPANPAFAVDDTDNHLLAITESGGAASVTYDILVIARSA